METGAFSGSRPIVRKDWISRLSVFVHCPIAREEPSVGYDFENNAAEGKYINSIVVSSSIENLGSPIAFRASQEIRGDQTLGCCQRRRSKIGQLPAIVSFREKHWIKLETKLTVFTIPRL
jgi:hypothetical protein